MMIKIQIKQVMPLLIMVDQPIPLEKFKHNWLCHICNEERATLSTIKS